MCDLYQFIFKVFSFITFSNAFPKLSFIFPSEFYFVLGIVLFFFRPVHFRIRSFGCIFVTCDRVRVSLSNTKFFFVSFIFMEALYCFRSSWIVVLLLEDDWFANWFGRSVYSFCCKLFHCPDVSLFTCSCVMVLPHIFQFESNGGLSWSGIQFEAFENLHNCFPKNMFYGLSSIFSFLWISSLSIASFLLLLSMLPVIYFIS